MVTDRGLRLFHLIPNHRLATILGNLTIDINVAGIPVITNFEPPDFIGIL